MLHIPPFTFMHEEGGRIDQRWMSSRSQSGRAGWVASVVFYHQDVDRCRRCAPLLPAPQTAAGEMAEPRFERCVKQHEHPLGLGTQRGMWPAMRSFGEGYTCSVCRKAVGEGHLRCFTGCDWDLCGKCAQASIPL